MTTDGRRGGTAMNRQKIRFGNKICSCCQFRFGGLRKEEVGMMSRFGDDNTSVS